MRIKEIDRTANVAWSPADQYPIYLATGTAAQQLDATFSTSSSIDCYSLNLAEATLDMPQIATKQTESRFHKVLWGSFGIGTTDCPAGVIVTGADNGDMQVYNADALINQKEDSLMFNQSRHTGAIRALDLNPFQKNLLASGGGESEIYIWDLNKPENPMTPGQKSQPLEDVSSVAWNQQVQHILGSTLTARCVVWDLRKNEPIIKVSDSMSRIKCKQIVWHPEVATQLMLSSEDDHTPVIQLWDLRYATSPLKVLENHQRGVLSMAWCPRDPDLLLSCGKDNRILCWNPNSNVQGGEVVYEIPTSNQWCFDVQWCPRNPSLISGSTFDGHITIYSLMGGGHPIQPSNKVAESFNTMEPFAQAPIPVPQEEEKVIPLQKPPKWLRKPVGATFGFGGKLVSFSHMKPQNPQQPVPKQVFISQVVTETEILNRSSMLEQATNNNQFLEYCAMKASNSSNTMEESIWNFLRVNFEKEPRKEFLQLLGYNESELAAKVGRHTAADAEKNKGVDASELAQKMSQLGSTDLLGVNNTSSSGQVSPNVSKTPNIDSRDELSDGSAAFDEIATQSSAQSGLKTPLVIPKDSGADGLMTQALLTGNFEAAVDMCLSENKMAEAILLAIAGGPELLSRTQKIYFQRNKSNLGRLISSIVTHDWTHIIETCDLENWKEALAVILTYSKPEEFAPLCDSLAARLESEDSGNLSLYASLCYICSGNIERLVENWIRNTENNNEPLALQDLVEKVMILRNAVAITRGSSPQINSGPLAERLNQYACILAAQGNLYTALGYLGNANEPKLAILLDRLYQAIGQPIPGMAVPAFPFQKVNLLPTGARQPQQLQQKQQSQYQAPGTQQRHTARQAHQAQAKSGFQTTTTPSSNYYNPTAYQSQYNSMNGPAGTQTTYMPQPAVSSAPVSNKGPLAHKYPTPTQPVTGYGMDPTYSQQNYVPPQNYSTGYSQNQNYYNSYNNTSVSSQPTNVYDPMSSQGGSYNPPPPAALSGPAQPSYQDVKAENAWNDPPLVKEKKPAPKYDGQTAVSSAYYSGVPQSNNDQVPPGAPNYSNLYNPQEHQMQQMPATYNYSNLQRVAEPQATAPPPEPPKPVVKGPIPQEHQVLQDVFNKLVNSCLQVATNAQMKRKLEDVSRKLEILYDKLRNNGLSQNVLMGLHQIVQYIQQFDYNTSLAIYTQMISQGNFSEISAFMPGIKVLLQTATQHQVYAQ